ncbi:glycosyltransferase [Candidatus Peribacteria bacterium]|nr:glycosyltransferase [Candidatus Peribacteria bacterium]
MPTEGLPPVDIIIPVFNQPQWLDRCLRSILERTDHVEFRIIIVDDCSTDPAIAPLLQTLSSEHPAQIIVLRNAENRGFVHSVNRGLRYSDRDVVILNTDTEVSTGWLTRMTRIACSDARIASVTPLSTEASLYSLFQSPAERQYAEAVGTEGVACLVERYTECRSPQIPTGVGFCMYMKRRAIDAIGTLDVAFGRGYGEETDWCMRASGCGWKHVLDDSTFVYHEGHVTMRSIGYLGALQTCIPEHERLLRERYPDFDARIAAFLEHDTVLTRLRRRLTRHAVNTLAENRRRIAFVVHDDPHGAAQGGTELHVYDLLEEMRVHCDVLVLHPGEHVLNAHRYVGALEERWTQPMEPGKECIACEAVLRQIPRDIVHVHHTLDLGFDILQAAKQSGAHVVYSVHDYYAISPNYTLTDERGMFAGIPKRSKRCPDSGETHGTWQERARAGLRCADTIVAPSSSALALFDTVFKDISSPRRVIPHGIPGEECAASGDLWSAPTVCILGYVHAHQKGRAIVEPVVQALADAGVHCVLLGSSAEHFPTLRSPLIEFLGGYKRYDLPSILQRIRPHAVAILSTYPETFCYALSESWQAGIPAYVTDCGALGERMRATDAGWIAPSQDPTTIARDIIVKLSGSEYRKALRNTQMVRLRTRKEMAEAYVELYDELCTRPLPLETHDEREDHWNDANTYAEAMVSPLHRRMPDVVRAIPGWLRDSEVLKLYALAFAAKHCIVEVGCYAGKSTTVLACGARDSGKGVPLVSIDISPRHIAHAQQAVGEHARYPCTFLTGRSCDVLGQLPSAPDLVFIDGNHSYEGAREDLRAFDGMLRPEGTIALHDYCIPHNTDPLDRDHNVMQAQRDALDRRYSPIGTWGSIAVFRYDPMLSLTSDT